MNQTITAVTGLVAGHHTDLEHATGCTVFLCREGAVGGVDVRGGSPGTRETDLLRPVHRVDQVHAVVLSGGSAFGLDAASGVVAYLESQGIGFKVGTKDNPVIVPIVSSAILYDLGLITSKVRPGPEEGRNACLSASSDPMTEGSVGAGTGAQARPGPFYTDFTRTLQGCSKRQQNRRASRLRNGIWNASISLSGTYAGLNRTPVKK